MKNLLDLYRQEPAIVVAAVTGLVDAALILAVSFGLPVKPDQKVTIDGFVSAALVLVGLFVSGVVTRSAVSPVVKP